LENAGFPDEIIEAIEAITKRPHEDYQAYLNRVMGNAIPISRITLLLGTVSLVE
jgi:hypothetical protein